MGVSISEYKVYMVTEFLEGGSLFNYLHKKNKRIPTIELLPIIEDIALGMRYLH